MADSKKKAQILAGVPYTCITARDAVSDTGLRAYAYQSDLLIGSVDPKTLRLQIRPDWETASQPFLHAYRESLRQATQEKLAARTTPL